MRRVVVTGMGMVSPLACGVEASWARILKGESGARKIEKFDVPVFSEDVGVTTDIGDGIAQVYGLAGVQAGEIVEFSGGVPGHPDIVGSCP